MSAVSVLLAVLFVMVLPSMAGAPAGGLPGAGVFSYHGALAAAQAGDVTIADR
jgi:hypothetical protein